MENNSNRGNINANNNANNIDYYLNRLKKSNFRSKFKLKDVDKKYVQEKGYEVIKSHAYDFINSRLAPQNPTNDGKQTPMRGHPVFIAQHATATCCRGCLNKWYYIEKNRPLTANEIDFVVALIMAWIKRQ